MKRVFTLGILIIICFVLQTALFPYIEIAGTAPDLMLILTVSFGLMRGRKKECWLVFLRFSVWSVFWICDRTVYDSLYDSWILQWIFPPFISGGRCSLPMLIILIDDLFLILQHILSFSCCGTGWNFQSIWRISFFQKWSIQHWSHSLHSNFCICEQDTKASGKSKRIRTGRKIQW